MKLPLTLVQLKVVLVAFSVVALTSTVVWAYGEARAADTESGATAPKAAWNVDPLGVKPVDKEYYHLEYLLTMSVDSSGDWPVFDVEHHIDFKEGDVKVVKGQSTCGAGCGVLAKSRPDLSCSGDRHYFANTYFLRSPDRQHQSDPITQGWSSCRGSNKGTIAHAQESDFYGSGKYVVAYELQEGQVGNCWGKACWKYSSKSGEAGFDVEQKGGWF